MAVVCLWLFHDKICKKELGFLFLFFFKIAFTEIGGEIIISFFHCFFVKWAIPMKNSEFSCRCFIKPYKTHSTVLFWIRDDSIHKHVESFLIFWVSKDSLAFRFEIFMEITVWTKEMHTRIFSKNHFLKNTSTNNSFFHKNGRDVTPSCLLNFLWSEIVMRHL